MIRDTVASSKMRFAPKHPSVSKRTASVFDRLSQNEPRGEPLGLIHNTLRCWSSVLFYCLPTPAVVREHFPVFSDTFSPHGR